MADPHLNAEQPAKTANSPDGARNGGCLPDWPVYVE